jgi:hypothetical protein
VPNLTRALSAAAHATHGTLSADITVKDPAHNALIFDNVHQLEVGRVTVFQTIPQHFKHQMKPWIQNFERNVRMDAPACPALT